MKIKDLIAAIRDYSKLRQALEESNTELDLSRMECAQLQSKINELEPLVDEYYDSIKCNHAFLARHSISKCVLFIGLYRIMKFGERLYSLSEHLDNGDSSNIFNSLMVHCFLSVLINSHKLSTILSHERALQIKGHSI